MHCLSLKWALSSAQVASVMNWSAWSSSAALISAASAELQPAPAPPLIRSISSAGQALAQADAVVLGPLVAGLAEEADAQDHDLPLAGR
jgi:hypothetical protein